MTSKEFVFYRHILDKTQKETAQILGVSLKAVNSYEQGWRNIPPHIERQILFLLAQKVDVQKNEEPCWICRDCPPEKRESCPSWEFQCGDICWFICGTKCQGFPKENWGEKIEICKSCSFFKSFMDKVNGLKRE